MKKTLAILALLMMSACGGEPAGGNSGGGGSGSAVKVPEEMAHNLRSASYDAAGDKLSVNMALLDASPVTATFRRAKSLDVAGYEAFTFQENNTQRSFIALFRKSGGVVAGVVGDGGQFAEVVQGATYERYGKFTRPSSGLITYQGTYAGILNGGAGGNDPFDPKQPARTTGKVQINADFTDDAVNGGVKDRRIIGGGDLDDINLKITKIEKDGSFEGVISKGPTSAVGKYAGIFGGRNANDVAALLVFTPSGPGLQNVDGTAKERGVIAIHCVKKPKGVPCTK